MEVLLNVENLAISFGGLKAVDSVSFDVEKGKIFSIIGPNGAGKTTIFNCISGIYKPGEGAIRFNGTRIDGRNPAAVARFGIARTFQNIELFSHMTAIDNIMLGRHIHMKTGLLSGAFMFGRRSKAAKEEVENRRIAEKVIDLLDLQSARDHFVGELPYGKQKLVELA
ncbi:MAG: ATP-binding cassette domain-containing protein, partial [bacterium]|nr:ATP-binding cassette domain-containing protein [bacterium]